MAALSDFLENKLIDHLFRSATFAKPAALHVALFTVASTDAGAGTEVSGGAYARVNLPPLDTNWTATQGGTTGESTGTVGHTDNAVEIVFPAPTATWGTVVAFAIFDAAVSGNMLVHGALTTAKTVNSGDPAPKFVVGDLDFTLA